MWRAAVKDPMNDPMNDPRKRFLLVFALLAAVLVANGCNSSPRADRRAAAPVEQTVRVTQHVGGMHYRVINHGKVLYQTFGPELLVLEPSSNRLLRTVELGAIGQAGSAIDMLIHDERLYVVLDRDEVVEVSVSDPETPRVLSREPADALGILPRQLSVAEGQLYISGIGGVARWEDGFIMLRREGDVGRVVMSADGLVACDSRRIYRLADGQYVGSASDLIPADGLDRAPEGSLVFTRQAEAGALVGLMTPNLREVDVDRTSFAVPGMVRSVRVFDNMIWVVTDTEILAFRLLRETGAEAGGLRLINATDIDVIGARDVAKIDDAHLAVVGSFGRSLYRLRSTARGPGDTFVYAHREPSRLMHARTDGRHILAGGPEGAWLYQIGSRVQPTEMELDDAPEPPTTASTVDARAAISIGGRMLTVETDSRTLEYRERGPGGIESKLHTVVSVEGEFWVGHDDGITVLALPEIAPTRARAERVADGLAAAELRVVGRVRLDGPVRHLFPMRADRGVSFVSTYGGFGIARYADEPAMESP